MEQERPASAPLPQLVLATWTLLALACGDSGPVTSDSLGTDTQGPVTVTESTTGSDTDSEATTDVGTETTAGPTTDPTTDSDSDSDTATDTEDPPPDPGDPWEPPPEPAPLPDDVIADIGQTIDGILDGPSVAGTTQSVLIVDLENGQLVYQRNPELRLKPASNTKLLSSAAAMETLGPDHQSVAQVYAEVAPDNQGVVNGDLLLLGQHDPTWSTWFYASPRFALDQIAGRLSDAGVTQVNGSVVAMGEFLWDGFQFGTYDAAAHRADAAVQFRDALIAAGITVGATATSPDFDPPDGASLLTSWTSPSLAATCYPLNVSSHNEMADILARHIGYEAIGESTYGAGTTEMVNWLESIGSDTTDVVFYDGSGLSHDNRISARNIVDLIDAMTRTPVGEPWIRTLSIAGIRGTLAGRMLGADTAGRFYGKTGTLNGVIATSGVLYHRHDGHRYMISILMNQVPNANAARAVQDDVVEAVAVDLRMTGPRPAIPTLQLVTSDGAEGVAVVHWNEPFAVDGTIVWLSKDGKVWDRGDARYVTDGTLFRAGELPWMSPEDRPVFVRVSAWSDAAGESDPSDVYAMRPDGQPARVLLVDGDDRWQIEAGISNSHGGNNTFLADHAHAVAGRSIDSVANEAVVDGDVELADYDAVIWSLGEESTAQESFDATEQELVRAYLEDDGGRMFISGAEIGWDLVEQGDAADMQFFADVLRAEYQGDDAETYTVLPVGSLFGGIAELEGASFYNPGGMRANYPDRLAPVGGSELVLGYVGGLGGGAGVAYNGDYGLVLLGFPLEALDNAPARALLMESALSYLGV